MKKDVQMTKKKNAVEPCFTRPKNNKSPPTTNAKLCAHEHTETEKHREERNGDPTARKKRRMTEREEGTSQFKDKNKNHEGRKEKLRKREK